MYKKYKIIPYNNTDGKPCFKGCPLWHLCYTSLDEYGNLTPKVQLELSKMTNYDREATETIFNQMITCKKAYPKYIIKEMESPTRHVLIGKTGREIASANSFGELLLIMFGGVIGGAIVIAIIGAIVSGFASLFK